LGSNPEEMRRAERSGLGLSLRSGLLVVAALIAATLSFPAGAAALMPCDAGVPTGEVVYQGAFTHSPVKASTRALRASGAKQRPIRPATAFAGEHELPVSSVFWSGRNTVVRLGGGIEVTGRGTSVAFRQMRVVLKPGVPRSIVGRVGSRELRLFTLDGAELRRSKGRISEIELTGGLTRLTGPAARLLSGRLGIRGLRKGSVWSRPDLFVRGAGGGDLVGELPDEAPVVEEPDGAIPIESATIRWRIRESFVNYLSSGGSVSAVAPGVAGPPESFRGGPELVYDFDLPFASGWVGDESEASRAVVTGDGGVWFRLCRNTINFTLTDPELILEGDDSRLVVRATGTDGTAYDGRRVTVLRLFPSLAERVETNGRETTLEGIPAYVADGATGVFLSYPAFPGSLSDPAAELSRFGSVTATYTRASTG
jgi:hypothetical protein